MDLSSYLASVKRFAWLLIIVPLLVGAGTAAWTIHRTPSLHSGTVSVSLPITTGIAAEADELSDDFTYAATAPQVEDSVAHDAGISTTALENGLHVSRVGTVGTYMKVTFNSKVLAQAQSVPPNVALQALTFILGPRIQIAKNLQASLGTTSAGVTAAQQAMVTKAIRGATTPTEVADASGQVKSTPAYSALTSRQNQLLQEENQAATTVATLTADLAAAHSVNQSAVADLTTTSSTKTAVTHAVANGAAALFLLLLLLVTFELIRPSGRAGNRNARSGENPSNVINPADERAGASGRHVMSGATIPGSGVPSRAENPGGGVPGSG
jgi:hypothetical protein